MPAISTGSRTYDIASPLQGEPPEGTYYPRAKERIFVFNDATPTPGDRKHPAVKKATDLILKEQARGFIPQFSLRNPPAGPWRDLILLYLHLHVFDGGNVGWVYHNRRIVLEGDSQYGILTVPDRIE